MLQMMMPQPGQSQQQGGNPLMGMDLGALMSGMGGMGGMGNILNMKLSELLE